MLPLGCTTLRPNTLQPGMQLTACVPCMTLRAFAQKSCKACLDFVACGFYVVWTIWPHGRCGYLTHPLGVLVHVFLWCSGRFGLRLAALAVACRCEILTRDDSKWSICVVCNVAISNCSGQDHFLMPHASIILARTRSTRYLWLWHIW